MAGLFAAVFLLLPLINVFCPGLLRRLWRGYWKTLADKDTVSAIGLTLLVSAISVPLNVVFGVAAPWAIAKFEFRGKAVLLTFIDLPFSVSPVVAGLMFVLLCGANGLMGPWLRGAPSENYLCHAWDCPGHHFCHLSFRGARIDSHHGRPGPGAGGSGADAGRQRLADLLARFSALSQMGPVLRHHPLQCPGHGRIRRGLRGVQQDRRARRTPCRCWWKNCYNGIHPSGGALCRGHFAGAAGPGHPGHQDFPGMEKPERRERPFNGSTYSRRPAITYSSLEHRVKKRQQAFRRRAAR